MNPDPATNPTRETLPLTLEAWERSSLAWQKHYETALEKIADLERALAEAKSENRKLTLELGAERMGAASRAGTLDLEVELKETKRHRDSLSSENERLKAELEGHAFDLSPAMVQLKTTAPDLAHAIPEMAGGTSDGPPSGAVTFCCPLCGEPDFDKIGLRLHFARLACSQLKNGSAIDLSHIEEIENRHHRDLAATRQKLAEAQADCAVKADAIRKLLPMAESGRVHHGLLKDTQPIIEEATAALAGDALVKELERLRAELAKAHEETRWWHQCLTLVSHALTGNTEALTNLSEDNDWKRAFECVAFQQAKDLRAQRDQAVALARELGERLQEECNIDDRTGKPRWSNTREALAKLQFLNPPPSDDTLKV